MGRDGIIWGMHVDKADKESKDWSLRLCNMHKYKVKKSSKWGWEVTKKKWLVMEEESQEIGIPKVKWEKFQEGGSNQLYWVLLVGLVS